MRFFLLFWAITSLFIAHADTILYTTKVTGDIFYITHPDIGTKSTIRKEQDEWVVIPRPDGLRSIPVLLDGVSPYRFWVAEELGGSGGPTLPEDGLLQWITGANDGVSAFNDNTSNEYNLDMIQSFAMIFDGVNDEVAFGDSWQTSDPMGSITLEVEAIGTRWTAHRWDSGSGEWDFILSGGAPAIFLYNNGSLGSFYSVTADSALSLNTKYDIEWWYDRSEGEITLRYSLAGQESWTTKTTTSVPSLTLTDGDQTGLAGKSYTGAGATNLDGTIYKWELYDYTTGLLINKYSLAEGAGPKLYDSVGGEDGDIQSTSGLETMWSARQDDIHVNMINGCSRVLEQLDTTEIAVSGLAGTEIITSTGTATVTPSAGKLTIDTGYVVDISIDGELTYVIADSYGDTIVSVNETWGDGVLTGGGIVHIPALDDGSNDALSLGITNPKVESGVAHNGAETLLQQPDDAGQTTDLDHSTLFYSDGETLDVNELTNGEFTSDLSSWSGANWAWSAGTALHTAGSTAGLAQSTLDLPADNWRVTYDITGRTAGTVTPLLGIVAGTTESSNATHTEVIVTTISSTTTFQLSPSSDFDGAIDNVKVQRVAYEDGDRIGVPYGHPTIPSFKTWVSGTDNTWVGARTSGGTCLIEGIAIYEAGKSYTPEEYDEIVGSYPNTCGAGQLSPLTDTNGVYIVDTNGYVILVAP